MFVEYVYVRVNEGTEIVIMIGGGKRGRMSKRQPGSVYSTVRVSNVMCD